ncbi:phosphodiester glycosidase family protein [Paenibacillus sp. H1-7]|nr:phosphodiester glycosidase family protein [Paenibacillus sp. H1-7]
MLFIFITGVNQVSTAVQWFESTAQQLRNWSLLKKLLMMIALLTFLTSSFLFLTGPGTEIRIWMAQTVIITQHRDWAWMFVGPEKRDDLVRQLHANVEENALEKQNMNLIKPVATRKNRSIDELIKVEDISGKLWKGKRMYVFDPKSIRIMTPEKSGEGERISSMVKRTGAVAGVNAGGFTDPEGLGNGFAAIGAIISGGDIIFTDQDGSVKQHIVGFTKDGTLVIGKYDMFELEEMGISEAASFYPRVIANGKPLPINDNSRAPRTAVGQKADGTVIFIVVDGRQVHSVGATLKEIQDMFLEDDVVNAGFLDGGASSELVVNGEVVTKPSSRYGERRLPSAFLVYDDPDSAVANRVWDGVDKIDAGGSYDHPDFLREQAELKAKQKNNPTPTSTPTPTPPPKKTDTGTNGSKGTTGSNDSDTKESSDKGSTPKPTPTPTPTPTPGHNNGSGNSTPDPNKPSTGGNTTGNEGTATPTPKPTPTPTPTPSATPTPKPGNEPQNGNNGTSQPPKANNGGSAGAPGVSGNTPDAPGTPTPKPTPTPAAGSGTGGQQQ